MPSTVKSAVCSTADKTYWSADDGAEKLRNTRVFITQLASNPFRALSGAFDAIFYCTKGYTNRSTNSHSENSYWNQNDGLKCVIVASVAGQHQATD